MRMTERSPIPFEVRALARMLASFRECAQVDVAFGGRALPSGTALEITEMCGTRTRSLANLVVGNGAGIGAKALETGRPASVTNYLHAEGFTHAYDHAVRPESLVTVVALPVVVDRVPRLVVYLATRSQVGLGGRWFDSLGPLLRRLERDIAVDDEVQRRMAHVTWPATDQSALSRADLREIASELSELAAQITDPSLHARVEAVRTRCAQASAPAPTGHDVALTPRETDVLQEIARGATNRQAADSLGLLPNTVKAYLQTAMRKLDATNRVQAITAARDAGLVR